MLVSADDHLLVGSADLDHIKRRPRCHTQPLALAYGEVVDAAVLADDFAAGGHQFASGVGQRLASVCKISVDEALIVAARDETDFLGIRLLRQRQTLLACELPHLRLRHVAQREQRAAELLLRKAEQEVSLILAVIRGTLEQPTSSSLVVGDASIVAGCNLLRSNLLGHNQ